MNRQHLPIFAVALAILIVGALAVGVRVETLLVGLLVLTCPLMMLFMHGSHGERNAGQRYTDERHHHAGPR